MAEELLQEQDSAPAPAERTTEELDLLADNVGKSSRNSERPMTAPPEKEKPQTKEEFEFEHGGKKIKGTREQLIKWAQMGYDRPQFMQKFNQEKAQLEAEKQKYAPYLQIDEFAAKNPQWWNFIQQQWNARSQFNPQTQAQTAIPSQQPGQALPANDPYAPKLQSLEQKLSQIEQFANQWQQEKILEVERAEDHKLEQEIQSIRKEYEDLDWQSLDENGKSLEFRVLEHAQANGIPRFSTAFRDLLHNDLIARAQGQAKIAVSQGIQAKTKLGVLGKSPTPKSTQWMPPTNKDIRKTSYEELENEIRQELRSKRA